jgi:hypothetical protein
MLASPAVYTACAAEYTIRFSGSSSIFKPSCSVAPCLPPAPDRSLCAWPSVELSGEHPALSNLRYMLTELAASPAGQRKGLIL